ncbi:hypothetical protein SFRURICE_000550 [Spodoptera frugiperda]|uniref:SFRICE_012786 n=1 Tax=Spodoptera frugiperda TaxID=7108 RepID=A0A2H1V5N6_SPOFR|nr:hypothetical protein SFRURICE_000550 [Spodoptera frugiperda]
MEARIVPNLLKPYCHVEHLLSDMCTHIVEIAATLLKLFLVVQATMLQRCRPMSLVIHVA